MSETTPQKVKDELVPEILADDSIIINPSETLTKHIIDGLFNAGESTHAKIMANEDVIRSLQNDFLSAAKTVELMEYEHLQLFQINNDNISGSIIASDDELRCIVDITGNVIISSEEEYDDTLKNTVEQLENNSEEFNIRTPALQHIYDTMREDLGDEVANDYQSVIEGIDRFDTGMDEMDEVAAALLVAAQHDILLYDVSKWGEDCGLASKATFSRTKTTLEERGYIITEKVPIDVGRPRLRLQLAPNVFEEEYDGQVISVVQGNL